MMLWSAFSVGLAVLAAQGPNPLMTGVFFRVEREILHTFAPCEHVSDDPSTARCRIKLYGRPCEVVFLFDETHRVHAVLLAFPPVPSIDDTQDLMKAMVNTLSGQLGPPNVQKTDAGAVWSWSTEHGVATVKLAKTDAEVWLVTASLKEGHLPGRFSE